VVFARHGDRGIVAPTERFGIRVLAAHNDEGVAGCRLRARRTWLHPAKSPAVVALAHVQDIRP